MIRCATIATSFFLASLSGCATPSNGSWVDGKVVTDERAGGLAVELVQMVGSELPPASSTVRVSAGETEGVLGQALRDHLRQAGYAVADGKVESAGPSRAEHLVRYSVSQLESRVLLRVEIDMVRLAEVVTFDAGGQVVAVSPRTRQGDRE